MRFPSGDQAGSKPPSVRRRTDSPVAPIRKRPPPSRDDRNTSLSPSGEKAACSSSAYELAVMLIARPPSVRIRKTSRLPDAALE